MKKKSKKSGLAIALGNFDGVHIGHQIILKKLIASAKKNGLMSCVYTFDPHPAKILSPKTAPLLLQTREQKLESLKKMGLDKVVVEKFNAAFSRRTPEAFFEKILLKKLRATSLWVGYDFTFGVKRSGNVALLKKFCEKYGVALHVTDAQFAKQTLISSSQIRNLVSQGKVKMAAALLGRPYALRGLVKKGYGIGGKQLGIHTANLKWENELLPKIGIYITRTKITSDERRATKSWPSATSVGFNPTFPGKGFSVETHLIGFEGNLVGKKIEVEFLEWMREEFTFPNAETLATQIKKDIAEALKYNETLGHHR